MLTIGTTAVNTLVQMLDGGTGLTSVIDQMHLEDSPATIGLENIKILEQHVSSDLAERSPGTSYPVVYVYCQRLRNLQREKFRLLSGTLNVAIEIRVTHDRLDHLHRGINILVDAALNVLSSHTGIWGDGICYGGGYDIVFGGVKRGGKNYLQAATIEIELHVSCD